MRALGAGLPLVLVAPTPEQPALTECLLCVRRHPGPACCRLTWEAAGSVTERRGLGQFTVDLGLEPM